MPTGPMSMPAPNATRTPSAGIAELRINGEGRHSFNNPAEDLELVERFTEALRNSPCFEKEGVEIVEPPPAMTDKETFNFGLRARLAKPINQ